MKKIVFTFFAVLLTAGIFSFTTAEHSQKKMTTFWYEFQNAPGNDPDNPLHYIRMDEEPECTTGTIVCAVKAPPASAGDLEHPNLDPGVREDTRFKSEN